MHVTGEMKPAFKFLFFSNLSSIENKKYFCFFKKKKAKHNWMPPAQKAGCECESRCGQAAGGCRVAKSLQTK